MIRVQLEEALWESLKKNPVTCLWGMPGSGRRQLAERVRKRWAYEAPEAEASVECHGISSPLLLFEKLNEVGAPGPKKALFLHDVGLGPEQTSEVIRAAEVLGWKKVFAVTNHPLPESEAVSISADLLNQTEALELLRAKLPSMGLTLGEEHREIARQIGGSVAAIDAVANTLAILPPAEVIRLKDQPLALLDLSPRAGLLEALVLGSIELLPDPLSGMARRWAFLGCPIRPGWQEALFGLEDPEAIFTLVQAQLVEPFGAQFRPLPHFVWAVRRHVAAWQEEHDEAWKTLAKWFCQRCRQKDLASALALERRSWNSPAYVQAWKTAADWAIKAGLSRQDQNAMRLMASAHALMGDCLDSASELLESVTFEPSWLRGSADIILGTMLGFKGKIQSGVETLLPAIAQAKAEGLDHLAAGGLYRLGVLYLDQGQTVSAELAFRQGAETVGSHGTYLVPRLLDSQAFALSFQGRKEESLAIQLRAVQLWEESGHPAAEIHAKLAYARVCLFGGKVEQAEVDLKDVIPRLVEADFLEDAALASLLASAACMVLVKFDDALVLATEAEASSRRSGASLFRVWGRIHQCWALLALRRDQEADSKIDDLACEVLNTGHKMVYSTLLSLYAAQAARRGEHQLAVFLEGSAAVEREKTARSLSTAESAVLAYFLAPSRAALPPGEAASLARAGSLIPAEQAVPLLMINRDLLLRPSQDQLSLPGVHLLTAREHEVLNLLAEGMTNRQLAEVLQVTEGTIKRQIHSLNSKLKTDSRFQLIQTAKRLRPEGSFPNWKSAQG